jgi:hypothetical protein
VLQRYSFFDTSQVYLNIFNIIMICYLKINELKFLTSFNYKNSCKNEN